MQLSEVCLRELYQYFGIEPATQGETSGISSSSSHDGLRRSADRYQKFRNHAAELLKEAQLDDPGFDFLYAVLPTLYTSAMETYDPLPIRDKQIEQAVSDFLSGYRISFLPLNPVDIAIKTLEKTLFSRIEHRDPSLDLGIGDGYASDFIFRPRKLTVGSEPSLLSILSAKGFQRHQTYISIDATCIPFEDQTFTNVYLVHSIDHVRDRVDVLKEAQRVLKPGGTLALSDASQFIQELMPLSHIYRIFGFEELAGDAFNFFLDVGGERVDFYSPEIYSQTLENLGFEDIHVEYFMAPRLAMLCYGFYEISMAMADFSSAFRARNGRKMRRAFFDCIRRTMTPLIERDAELCRKENKGLNLFITAKKKGGMARSQHVPDEMDVMKRLVCPKCRAKMAAKDQTYSCANCGLDYPILDSTPLLIPFYAEAYSKITALPPRPLRKLFAKLKKKIREQPRLYRAVKQTKKFFVNP